LYNRLGDGQKQNTKMTYLDHREMNLYKGL